MARFVYRPKHPDADEFGMVEIEKAGPKDFGNAHYVISDSMDSTRHMANGRYYDSKSEFRKATKAAGCIEVGNETAALLRPRQMPKLSKEGRVQDIKRAIEQLRNRR